MKLADATRAKVRFGLKFVLALFGSVGFSFPLLAMLWYRASPLAMANESLAYRFMLSERILRGEGSSAWIWQGYFTSALETSLLALINHFSQPTPAQLPGRTIWYTYAYLSVVAAGGVVTFLIAACTRAINLSGMLLLVLAAAGPVFLTRTSGFYYFVLPDYFVLNVLFALLALLLFQCWQIPAAHPPPLSSILGRAAIGGVLLGFMVANKVTMIVIGAMPLMALVLRSPFRWRSFLLTLLVGFASAFAGFRFVLLWLYRFDETAASRALASMLESLHTFGAPETGFWNQQFRSYLVESSYGLLAAFFLFAAISMVIFHRRSGRTGNRHCLEICGLFLAGIMWGYFLSKRPAGTTFFEAAVSWLVLGCMALSTLPTTRKALLGVLLLSSLALIFAGVTFSRRYGDLCNGLKYSRRFDSDLWVLHREMLEFAAGREIVAVLPDNSFTYGGVIEFLLKGTSDFPTWLVSSHGRPALECYAPHLSFRTNAGGPTPNAPYPPNTEVFWVDRFDKPPLVLLFPRLRELNDRAGLKRKEWTIPTGDGRFYKAHALLTPALSPG